ncbi:histidine kinase [Formosa sp. Hel1_33_131]|uniref:PAS domain S-box protein n=1 Tax=Formosa sp. Hel1_33_131 TaxID=1336794 RepID=UPI00084E1D8E|nr:PAS domain S-box protein [Formosa sp. Hel1_33_131]AOR27920.1 histidine kinase [Formosa sp. Hel1_33_131]
MSLEKVEILDRALKREKAARKAAERILEEKSRDLYFISEELKDANLQFENLLVEKSSQLQGVFENINDAYLVIDLEGEVLKMNDVATEFFGYNIDNEKVNATCLIYPKDKDYAFNSFKKLKKQGFFTNYVARILTKQKEIKWVQINATIIFNKEKKAIGAQGIVRNITSNKEAEDLLIQSEKRLSSLILNLDSGILLEDEKRQIVLTNTKFCALFKIPVSPELLIGEDCSNASEQSKVLFKDPEQFVTRINEILKNKKQVLADEVIMTDGTILERDFIPIVIGPKYQGHLWAYRNVTLKRQYSQSLESQKEKYSSIIANMNLGLMEVNNNNEILTVNQSFVEMSGYSEKELLGEIGENVFIKNKDFEILPDQSKNRSKGKSYSREITIQDKKGVNKSWLSSEAPNYNLNGEIVGFIGIHLDITEFKLLEKQNAKILIELEKRNNELHEYAHIVSHDLKAPLRSIDALVSWIKSDNKGKLDEVTVQNFELIEETLETMESLIFNVLEYSSAGVAIETINEVDLNLILEDLRKIILIPENISVIILKKLPIVKGDITKFKQIFQNLVSNAVKFSDKEKGIIEVDFNEEGSFYLFSVKDNGIGIDEKHHDKIFKIFQSLNKSKESTGIGLSIVKKVVELYEGDIWLESEEGKGTTFYFTIKK